MNPRLVQINLGLNGLSPRERERERERERKKKRKKRERERDGTVSSERGTIPNRNTVSLNP